MQSTSDAELNGLQQRFACSEDNEGLHGGTSIGMAEFQQYQTHSATTSVFGNTR